MIINDIFLNVNEFEANDKSEDVTVIVTHGLAEYSKNYKELAEFLQDNNFNVITYDLRGHGKSLGKRGYIKSYDDYVSDLKELVNYAKKKTTKVFLIGHSMGGIITNLYVVKYGNVNGVIVTSSPFDYLPSIDKIRKFPFKKLLGLKQLKTSFTDTRLLHEINYVDDIYDLKKYYAKIGVEVLYYGIKYLNENISNYKVPALFIHGKKDKLVPYEHSEKISKSIESTDKTLSLYENSLHNIINDIEKEEVKAEILKWLVERK